MDAKVSVWKANLNSGVIIGLLGIVFSLIIYFLELSLKSWVTYIWFPIYIVALVLAIKSYRDNYMKGFMTYGQSMGAGVVVVLYYAIISSLFAYILYSYIDPGLIDKMIAVAEEKILARGLPESAVEQTMKIQEKLMKPWVLSVSGIFNSMFIGTIFVLIISIFTKKEGNPLIDEAIEE